MEIVKYITSNNVIGYFHGRARLPVFQLYHLYLVNGHNEFLWRIFKVVRRLLLNSLGCILYIPASKGEVLLTSAYLHWRRAGPCWGASCSREERSVACGGLGCTGPAGGSSGARSPTTGSSARGECTCSLWWRREVNQVHDVHGNSWKNMISELRLNCWWEIGNCHKRLRQWFFFICLHRSIW